MSCFRAWEEWSLFTTEYIASLKTSFLTTSTHKPTTTQIPVSSKPTEEDLEDIDGVPMDE